MKRWTRFKHELDWWVVKHEQAITLSFMITATVVTYIILRSTM